MGSGCALFQENLQKRNQANGLVEQLKCFGPILAKVDDNIAD
jgi:hypothetical protein